MAEVAFLAPAKKYDVSAVVLLRQRSVLPENFRFSSFQLVHVTARVFFVIDFAAFVGPEEVFPARRYAEPSVVRLTVLGFRQRNPHFYHTGDFFLKIV